MYRLMVMLAACVGLGRSEIFGLRWSAFNWLLREVFIQRSHVEGYEDETKTESSNAKVPLHPMIVESLLAWRQATPFAQDSDYVFASPILDGQKPLNSNSVQRDYLRPESIKAGLTPLGWHALRHFYRTWLGEKGTGPGSAERPDASQHNRHVTRRLWPWSTGSESGCECAGCKRTTAMKSVNGLLTDCIGW
jgi:integrase